MNTNDLPTHLKRPATFDRLMELYEHNYILIRRLFGDLRRLKAGDECPWIASVSPKIVANSRFTLDIQFTDHRILGRRQQPLRLAVRIYHDARAAELVETGSRSKCLHDQQSRCAEKQHKRNTMLQNWLIDQLKTCSEKRN